MVNKSVLILFLIAIGIVVISTSLHYGITWDEPAYFKATKLHLTWIESLLDGVAKGNGAYWLQDSIISQYWHWDPYHVPHPPLTRILSGLTMKGTGSFLGEIRGFRLSTALFFLVLLWTVWAWTRALTNGPAAWVAMISALAMPHLFGHAHFAMTDIPMATLWLLTAYAFWKGMEKTSWSILFGIFLGLAMATKFPGFLIPIPLIIWSTLYRENRPRIYKNFFAAVFLSPLVLVLVNPFFWHYALPRILEFIGLSITRPSFSNLFLNKIYFTDQLPWYYPFFMVGVSIPVSLLFLIVIGLLVSVPALRSHPDRILPVFCVTFLLILPLLPGAVIHDGVRLLLPVFPFLAVFGGVGFEALIKSLNHLVVKRRSETAWIKKIPWGIMGVILIPALISLGRIHPYELSYYNALIGGVRGADQKGLEVTYLQEVISPDFLEQMNRLFPKEASLNGTMSQFLLAEYQTREMLRKDIRLTTDSNCDYYLILMRKSSLRIHFDQRPLEKALLDRWIKEGKEPVLSRNVQGVPVLLLYKVR